MTDRANNQRERLRVGGPVLLLVVWWALLGALWMLLVDTASRAEEVSAVVVALVGAFVTGLVLASRIAGMRATAIVCSALARQLVRVPADLGLLAVALARALTGRRRPGRFHELALELAVDERGSGRRAGIELIGSLAPNTIVLGVDERRVIVHQLVARHGERAGVGEIGS